MDIGNPGQVGVDVGSGILLEGDDVLAGGELGLIALDGGGSGKDDGEQGSDGEGEAAEVGHFGR